MGESGRHVLDVIKAYGYTWSSLGLDIGTIKRKLESDINYKPIDEINSEVSAKAAIGAPPNFLSIFNSINRRDIYNAVDNSDLEDLRVQVRQASSRQREATERAQRELREKERLGRDAELRRLEREREEEKREQIRREAERVARRERISEEEAERALRIARAEEAKRELAEAKSREGYLQAQRELREVDRRAASQIARREREAGERALRII